MGTTNRAEELAKEYSLKMNGINFDNLFPNTDETIGEIGIKDFIAGYNSSQSEIDELTKVIDGYKSDSEELITTKELLLDLTISDKKVYDKQEQRIINLSEKLLISEKSEKFYKDRAKELSDILYLAESENAELTKEVERLRKGLPSIDEAGAIAVSVSSKVEPSLSAQEEAMFIAGFQECIKYLSNQITP